MMVCCMVFVSVEQSFPQLLQQGVQIGDVRFDRSDEGPCVVRMYRHW